MSGCRMHTRRREGVRRGATRPYPPAWEKGAAGPGGALQKDGLLSSQETQRHGGTPPPPPALWLSQRSVTLLGTGRWIGEVRAVGRWRPREAWTRPNRGSPNSAGRTIARPSGRARCAC